MEKNAKIALALEMLRVVDFEMELREFASEYVVNHLDASNVSVKQEAALSNKRRLLICAKILFRKEKRKVPRLFWRDEASEEQSSNQQGLVLGNGLDPETELQHCCGTSS